MSSLRSDRWGGRWCGRGEVRRVVGAVAVGGAERGMPAMPRRAPHSLLFLDNPLGHLLDLLLHIHAPVRAVSLRVGREAGVDGNAGPPLPSRRSLALAFSFAGGGASHRSQLTLGHFSTGSSQLQGQLALTVAGGAAHEEDIENGETNGDAAIPPPTRPHSASGSGGSLGVVASTAEERARWVAAAAARRERRVPAP